MTIPRFTHTDELLILRNDDDTDNGAFELKELKITGGTPDTGKIWTSDTDGQGSWEVNPAIQSAADAQAAAEAAQATADAAVADAAAASAAAAAADAAAAAAAAAAAVANGLAVAAGIDAATAQDRADAAYTLADVALDSAQRAYPESIRVFGDELHYITGTPANSLNTAVPYNWFVETTTDGADARITLNLRAGTWTFKFLTIVNNSAGRVTIAIGSTLLVDPEDLYAVTQDAQKIFTYTDVIISASDRYELRFLVNGQNGSSSGFGLAITKFWGYRSGA